MNWQKRKLILSLLIASLLIPTSAMGQRWQINLKKNESAPFDGVLVPYETYRKQAASDLELDLKNEELRNCLSITPESDPKGIQFYGYVLTFAAGAVAGFGGAMLLRQALR